MYQPTKQCLWDHASFNCQTVEQRVRHKDHHPVHITHPCLQWAYGRNWSIRHAGPPVKDPCQVKEMVYSPFWIHPWPVDCKTPGWCTRGTVTYWTRKQCLKRFCLAVAHSLTQVNKPAFKIGRPSLSSPPPPTKKEYTPRPTRPKPQLDVRYDNCGHWPLHCDKQGWCNLCPKGVSRWKCEKCNVFLCLNTNKKWFVAYH